MSTSISIFRRLVAAGFLMSDPSTPFDVTVMMGGKFSMGLERRLDQLVSTVTK